MKKTRYFVSLGSSFLSYYCLVNNNEVIGYLNSKRAGSWKESESINALFNEKWYKEVTEEELALII